MRTKAGIDPDRACLNSAISACGKAGEWRQSLLLLEQMELDEVPGKWPSPDVVTYR